VSITSSRLAFLCVPFGGTVPPQVIVWDWTTGDILLDLQDQAYWYMTFVDNFWLMVFFEDRREPLVHLGLTFLNTEQTKKDGEELTQTTFYSRPFKYRNLLRSRIFTDLGGHEPSCEDDLFAPFYPDPSQRILAFWSQISDHFLVIKVETLLRLAREWEGEDLRSGEWQAHATWVRCTGYASIVWVSGPRLCFVGLTECGGTSIDVYDFSTGASAGCTETAEDGTVWRAAPDVIQALPSNIENIAISCGYHDSLAFVLNFGDSSLYTLHTLNFV